MARKDFSFEEKAKWMRERQSADAGPAPTSIEQYLTPAQIAKMLQLSTDTVIRIFENQPGVLVVGDCEGSRIRRRYRTIRVPESVYKRVLRQCTNA